MTWFGWALVSLEAVGALVTITQVGKPRKPLEPRVAAFVVLLSALVIVGVLTVGTNR